MTSRLQRTLVMFSGGIDSTAALWHVISNAKDYGDIHVHHIHIHNVEGRWKAEAQAVKNILQWISDNSVTEYTSSESVMAVPAVGKNFLYDTEIISFITGYMTSRDPSIKKVIIGATGSDMARSDTVSRAVMRGKAIHNAFHGEVEDHSGAIKVYPHKHLSKQEVYDTLPQDLVRLTWSCRQPRKLEQSFVECGKCKTCRGELSRIKRVAVGR